MDDPRMETMQDLMAYLPGDRLRALARQNELPEHASGTVLLADISGFTSLTEALARALGPRRGAEELARQLNLVYNPLIAAVDQYGGSIVGFSGDAITCWFDHDSGLHAAACALAMQAAMHTLGTIVLPGGATVSLALKAAIAGGVVRRFRVGDPAIQLLDVLAGAPVVRVATAEQLAAPGEIVLDAKVLARLAGDIVVLEQRVDPPTQNLVYVVGGLSVRPDPQPVPSLEPAALEIDQLRPWVLPAVYERLAAGLGEFLAELRPAASLFVRFSGIDFDGDPAAGEKLDAYIGWVQRTLQHYGGTLLDVTVGDKGSYLSAAFGAPIAHHDDARRAALAALDLRVLLGELAFVTSVQLGIGRGLMYTGATGGTTRRTYCLRGDEVNLAARLMQAAAPGEILVSQSAQQASGDTLEWTSLAPLRVKGKSAPVPVFRLLGVREQRRQHLQEPRSTLPLVGREAELALLEQQLERALGGHGQLVAVRAEAGMGKSRLVAEVLQAAAEQQIVVYLGECLAYGGRSSYQVWTPIWSAFFDLDADASPAEQIQSLERQVAHIDQRLLPRLPLLGVVLNLPIPETELTASLDAELRKASLEALLVDCLQARARQGSLLIVLEDCHWIDPLSQDLLETVARAIVDLPVLMVTTERPPEAEHTRSTQFSRPRHRTEVSLAQLPQQDARHLVELKLKQVTGVDTLAVPGVVEQLITRAEGNPFYIEELVQYLGTQNVNLQDPRAVAQLELPTSLHSLILSRIDQLSERQKMTLKVASIIGRVFRFTWLWGVHPQLGEQPGVQADLEQLSRLDLTPLEQVEPELTYLFKHIITRDVVYESMPTAMRSVFHGQLGGFIEGQFTDTLAQVVDLLAYHYDLSDNPGKRREYLRKAGDAAKAAYANQSAIDYYKHLLPLLSDPKQAEVLRLLGEVLQLTGRWDEAKAAYEQALGCAERSSDSGGIAASQYLLGALLTDMESPKAARFWLDQAYAGFHAIGDGCGQADTLYHLAFVHNQLGDYSQALQYAQHQLDLATEAADSVRIINAHYQIGLVYASQEALALARVELQLALDGAQLSGYLHGVVLAGNDLAGVLWQEGDYPGALKGLLDAISTASQIGDIEQLGLMIGNAGLIYAVYGELERALQCYGRGLCIALELGDRRSCLNQIGNLAEVLARQRLHAAAKRSATLAIQLGRSLHIPGVTCSALDTLAHLLADQGQTADALLMAEEAESIAAVVSTGDTLFRLQVLVIELRYAAGILSRDEAVAALQTMRDIWSSEAQQATLCFAVWRLDYGNEDIRMDAARRFEMLYLKTYNIEFREQYYALTGVLLPEPPLLPPLSSELLADPIDLHVLLARVEAEL